MMALGQRDVSKLVIGPLTNYTVEFLRHLKEFFQIVFILETFKDANLTEEDEELQMGADKVLLACVGIGFTNLSKRTT